MEIALFALGLLPAVLLGTCLWRLLRRPRAASFAGRLAQATGLVALAGLVASLAQLAAAALEWIVDGFSLVFVATLPLAWWVLAGGWSVQQVFEETAKDVTGHRQSTFVDNWHYYLALTTLQTLVAAALVARRQQGSFARDPLAWLVLALALANSLAGIAWPWWGT
jgi:hypothetical protein